MAKRNKLDVPEGDFGSDVEGIKPIVFDVGNDEGKMQEALEYSRKWLGSDATILYSGLLPSSIQKMVMEQGKEAGGPWDCYKAEEFYGSEATKVVVVTDGSHIMELLTRAQTHIVIIIVKGQGGSQYTEQRESFQQAADKGFANLILERQDTFRGKGPKTGHFQPCSIVVFSILMGGELKI